MGQRPQLPRLLLAAIVLTSALGTLAEESLAYRGLWGNLFQLHANTTAPPRSSLHAALASLQSKLLDRLAGGGSAQGGSAPSLHASLEDLFHSHLNFTLSLLSGSSSAQQPSGGSGGGPSSGSSSLLGKLEQLHSQLSRDWAGMDSQQLAALALVQGWTLGAATAALGARAPGASAAAKPVADPAWASFRPHTCLRLQNFGNAEGYSAAVLGASPCTVPPGVTAAGNVAASSEQLRWGGQASFLLDCSRGSGSADSAPTSSSSPSGSGNPASMSGLMQVASKAAAASVAAALDRTTSCRLAVAGSGPGSSAVLQHTYEQQLLGAPKLDALSIRICNMAPSTMQYPAALAAGPSIRLEGLKLNGHPLLASPLLATQASAAGGCLMHLLRLSSSRATKAGYVLSGWLRLGDAGSGAGSGSAGAWAAPSGFGVGETASVELSLGEYSPLEAAATRLLGSAAQQAVAVAQAAGLAPP